MKLRNKKTGEITYINIEFPIMKGNEVIGSYFINNLAELNDKWEDYTSSEPLIKDEKIRKVVRMWADSNDLHEVLYDKDKDCIYSSYGSDNTDTSVSISFDDFDVFKKLEHRKLYSIAELCGKEEE